MSSTRVVVDRASTFEGTQMKRLLIIAVVSTAIVGCGVGGQSGTERLSQAASVEVLADSGNIEADAIRTYGPLVLGAGESLQAVLTMSNGDADLYLRAGAQPTESQFDCRPYLGGTDTEICDITGPGSVYINVTGYGWSTDFTLTVIQETADTDICGNGVNDFGEICDGSSVLCQDMNRDQWSGGTAACKSDCTGYDTSTCQAHEPGAPREIRFSGGLSESLGQGQWKHYGPFNTVAGDFRALIGHNPDGNPGSGDVDLYVGRGTWPTRDNYECRSAGPEAHESCTVAGGGLIYISIYSYENGPQGYGYARYSSEVYYWVDDSTVQPEIHHSFNLVEQGQWSVYGPFDGSNAEVEVILAGAGQVGLGDADLYVRSGAQPTEADYDCRPYDDGSDERCSLSSPGQFWVGVRGYKRTLFSLHTAIISH